MNAPFFVRQDMVPERPAPVKTTGFIGFLRTRLFNTPTNIVITILGALLLWFTVGPAIKFMNSALPNMVQPVSSEACLSLISGVLPIAWTTSLLNFILRKTPVVSSGRGP